MQPARPFDRLIDCPVQVKANPDTHDRPRSPTIVVPVPGDSQLISSRVGVVGAGQLARMMGEVAHTVGVELSVLALNGDDSAVATADRVVIGDPSDRAALAELAREVDVVTFDHELVDLELMDVLAGEGVTLRPGPSSLRYAVDKAYQRVRFAEHGLPVPRFIVVDSRNDPALHAFLDSLTVPPVVKVARGGYDGRGVFFPDRVGEVAALVESLDTVVVVEERLELLGEVAQLLVCARDGEVAHYPLVTTVQSDGMCVEVRFPSQFPELAAQAAALGHEVADLVRAIGIIAIELFVTGAGLVINEVALRPHNTGHWTIEGAATDQFSNHLRAVSGQRLGPTEPVVAHAVMVNVVGADEPAMPAAGRAVDGAFVHDYGKAWRPGRKLGHVTAVDDDAERARVTAWAGALAYGTRTREAK